MEYRDDNFIIEYYNDWIRGDSTIIKIKPRTECLFEYFVTRTNFTDCPRYYIEIRVLVEIGRCFYNSIFDTSLINKEDFDAMYGESRFDIAKCIHDTYLYRHELAMKAEYKMIDKEQLYDSEDPLNKMIIWCNPHYGKYTAKGHYNILYKFASIVAMDSKMNKSVCYTYSRIMCGMTPKQPTKSANN